MNVLIRMSEIKSYLLSDFFSLFPLPSPLLLPLCEWSFLLLLHTHTYTHTHSHTHIHTCTRAHTYTHTGTYTIHTHTHSHARVHAHTLPTCILPSRTILNKFTHKHMCTVANTHTHTRTHKFTHWTVEVVLHLVQLDWFIFALSVCVCVCVELFDSGIYIGGWDGVMDIWSLRKELS